MALLIDFQYSISVADRWEILTVVRRPDKLRIYVLHPEEGNWKVGCHDNPPSNECAHLVVP
jgi:hypothetical protein